MKKKKKVYIDTYESIYPVLLVVANEMATAKDLSKYFMWGDGCDILDKEIGDGCDACVFKVVRRSDKSRILLVKINKECKGTYAMKVAVHEAGHVVLSTYNCIEDNICREESNQEPFCYYLEWVTNCIYKTMTKK